MDFQVKEWSTDIFKKFEKKVEVECHRLGDNIPYIPINGRYPDKGEDNISYWTNGFWGGILWQLYHVTDKAIFRQTAEKLEERLDVALEQYDRLHHDVGFMWLHTSVANYRLTGNERSKSRGLHAANLLAGRYNSKGKFINAWNNERSGWMIIDCMMNLPLLHWAKETANLPHMGYIAEGHADTAMEKLVRPDGSVIHIGVMDTANGELLKALEGQGYSSDSSWSRGQAWAVYGFALSYLHTQKQEYLDVAKKVAHYFIANVSKTEFIPLLDFRAPEEPIKWDTTAGVIAACGLLEIAKHVGEYEKSLYVDAAISILKATEEKYANWNIDEDGIIGYGSLKYHEDEETLAPHKEEGAHVPIIYGDYFFIEGILRLKELDFLIW